MTVFVKLLVQWTLRLCYYTTTVLIKVNWRIIRAAADLKDSTGDEVIRTLCVKIEGQNNHNKLNIKTHCLQQEGHTPGLTWLEEPTFLSVWEPHVSFG